MSAAEQPEATKAVALLEHSVQRVRAYWWVFLALGCLLVVGGLLAIAYPFVSSYAAVLVLGVVLIVSGVGTILAAFWAGKWSSLMLQLLVGILYLVAGMAIRDAPAESVAVLTLFTAAFFIVVGAFRVIVALVERFPQWGWVLLNGIITFILGIVIYDTYPASALWVIGLLLGIDLLFNGWSWIMLAFFLRKLPDEEEEEIGLSPQE